MKKELTKYGNTSFLPTLQWQCYILNLKYIDLSSPQQFLFVTHTWPKHKNLRPWTFDCFLTFAQFIFVLVCGWGPGVSVWCFALFASVSQSLLIVCVSSSVAVPVVSIQLRVDVGTKQHSSTTVLISQESSVLRY